MKYRIKKIKLKFQLNNDNQAEEFNIYGDTIGTTILSKLDKNAVYQIKLFDLTIIAPDSNEIRVDDWSLGSVFPDSTQMLVFKYKPSNINYHKANYNIRISLEGDTNEEDEIILEKTINEFNEELSTVKIKLVTFCPTLRIILHKKNNMRTVNDKTGRRKSKINIQSKGSYSSDDNRLFFPELKVYLEFNFYSNDGLKDNVLLNLLYNQIAQSLLSFDKNNDYLKSNIIGNHFKRHDLPDSIKEKAWSVFKKKN